MSRQQFAVYSVLFLSPIAGFAFVVAIGSLAKTEPITPRRVALARPEPEPEPAPHETAIQQAVRQYIRDYYGENPKITKWQDYCTTKDRNLLPSADWDPNYSPNPFIIPPGVTILRCWYTVIGMDRDRVFFVNQDSRVLLVLDYEVYRLRAAKSRHWFPKDSELPVFHEPGDEGTP